MKLLRKLYFRLFKRYRRLQFCCVTYSEAADLICGSLEKAEPYRWVIAPEEDENHCTRYIYLERRERILS